MSGIYIKGMEMPKWLDREPPMFRVFKWRRWKLERPVWVEGVQDGT